MSSGTGNSRGVQDPNAGVRSFDPGDLVAGRFRIVRFIARGGGGEVYEAHDQELGEQVALKTVRAEIADNEDAVKRFKREILLARKVTHTNVCRIFDVFQHAAPDRQVLFLTMEFLSGETLTEKLRREGPMSPAEAIPLVRQMTDALTAAHAAGVVHRDFKTGNVMLCPVADGVRAVVMDFGLAFHDSVTHEKLTGGGPSGGILGTPAYMSPEQIEGKEVTTSTDIYALGLVLYEMTTGQLPFAGESVLTAMVKRVKEATPPPRTVVAGLDPLWDAVILRCLERDPADRFASAAEVRAALEGERVAPASRVARRRIVLAAILIFVVALAVIVSQIRPTPAPSPAPVPVAKQPEARPAPAAPSRRSVAVLGFKNLSGREESAWLSTALSEMLTAELGAGERLRTIPGENVVRMKADLKLPDTDTLANDTLQRIHTILGSDYIVLGSYLALGEKAERKIRLDLRIQDAKAGETVATVSDTSTEVEMLDLISRVGQKLRESMGAAPLSAPEVQSVRASLPSNAEAVKLYTEGLTGLRMFDAESAQASLQKAVAADPGYALAYSALSEVWSYMGHDDLARKEAKKALDLSANLPREDKLLVEGRFYDTAGDSAKTVETYAALFRLYPDNLDHGLRLAGAQDSAGKPKEGLQTLERLKALPAPVSLDPRIDLMEARLASSLSDYQRVLSASQSAVRKGNERQSRAILGQAHWFSGWAHGRMGESSKAMADYKIARQMFQQVGDDMRAARVLYTTGILLRAGGDISGAIRVYEEALAALKNIGNKQEAGNVLNSIGVAYWNMGQLALARKSYEEAFDYYTASGDRADTVYPLNNIALVLSDQGRLRDAWKMYVDALAISKETGNRYAVAWSTSGMAEVLMSEGKLAEAKKSLEEALAIRKEIDDFRNIVETRLELARIALFSGEGALGEKLARECAEEARKNSWREEEGYSQTVLALALLSQGQTAEARKSLDSATVLLKDTENFRRRVALETTTASVLAATGKAQDALRILEGALSETRKAGHAVLEFRVRLTICEVLLWSGDDVKAREALASLDRDARAEGMLLFAQRAQSLL